MCKISLNERMSPADKGCNTHFEWIFMTRETKVLSTQTSGKDASLSSKMSDTHKTIS